LNEKKKQKDAETAELKKETHGWKHIVENWMLNEG
jgi:hypothetical protein